MNSLKTCFPLALMFLISCTSTPESIEISDSRFEELVQSGDIKKLVLVVDEKTLEITLKPAFWRNSKYRSEIEKWSGPHFRLEIDTIGKFMDRYEKITKDIPADSIVDVILVGKW